MVILLKLKLQKYILKIVDVLPLKAGIPTEQLTLALEPEAASVFVEEMNVKREISDDGVSLAPYDPGTKYMVLDLGGR